MFDSIAARKPGWSGTDIDVRKGSSSSFYPLTYWVQITQSLFPLSMPFYVLFLPKVNESGFQVKPIFSVFDTSGNKLLVSIIYYVFSNGRVYFGFLSMVCLFSSKW